MIRTLNLVLDGEDDSLLKTDFETRVMHHIKIGVHWYNMTIVSRREQYDPRTESTVYVYDLMVP